jgi:hypothetical protein
MEVQHMRSRILGVLSVTGLAFGLAACAMDTPSFGPQTADTEPRRDNTGTQGGETPRTSVVVPPAPAPAPPPVVVPSPPAPAPPAVVVAPPPTPAPAAAVVVPPQTASLPPAVVVVTPGSPMIVQPESPEEDEAIPNTTPRHTGRH